MHELSAIAQYKNHEQQTSLYIASVYGEVETIELLLERGADVNALRWDGTSPIFGAATYARIDVLKLLLKAGADLDIFGKVHLTLMSSTSPSHLSTYPLPPLHIPLPPTRSVVTT